MVEAARIVGLVYVAYFILAVAGMTLRNMPLQLVGTGSADGAWLVLRRDGDRPLHRAPGLPQPMSWMYELPTTLHVVAGVAEILGGLGLVLPGLTRIRPELTPLAALGLVVVMVGAAAWHLTRGEVPNVAMNFVLGALAAFVAYGRWRIRPLARQAAAH